MTTGRLPPTGPVKGVGRRDRPRRTADAAPRRHPGGGEVPGRPEERADPDKRVDDIDHLGNRRVRVVGELLENQYRIGLVRMERAIKERMSLQEIETLMPHDLINSKPVSAVIKEFFGSSQLSQFMDQTNPLSSVTHKRRLSALGPGGLTRERAGFEVRDVHPTHYGRICPIETPEGPNIGLIASLSTFARVNDSASSRLPIASSRTVQGHRRGEVPVGARRGAARDRPGERAPRRQRQVTFVSDGPSGQQGRIRDGPAHDEVDMMDVSPNQLVSVAASLIPFLENDDANRALMGSNMQRQAVPLLRTQAPLVGTGMERSSPGLGRDGRREARRHRRVGRCGRASWSSPTRTTVPAARTSTSSTSSSTSAPTRTPASTRSRSCRPATGFSKGQVIADGPATDRGELALGAQRARRLHALGWVQLRGLDPDLRARRQGRLSSPRSTSRSSSASRATPSSARKRSRATSRTSARRRCGDLDEAGIVRIGAEVKPDDILVGKITPKGETQLSPEERLLRAIFGEKAGDVRDTSLRVPPGVTGTVIGAQVFSRRGVEKDERARRRSRRQEIERLRKDQEDEIRIIRRERAAPRFAIAHWARRPRTASPTSARVDLAQPKATRSPRTCSTRFRPPLEATSRSPTRVAQDVAGSTVIFASIEEQANVIKAVFDEKIARSRRATSCRRASSRWSRSTWPSSASSRSATRWPAATATRA